MAFALLGCPIGLAEKSINCPPGLPEALPLLEAVSTGRAGGCRRLCRFCVVLPLGLCGCCVLSSACIPSSTCHLRRGPWCPHSPVGSAARLAPGWPPDPFGSGMAGQNALFPLLVAALLCSAVQSPCPALPALSRPWFFGCRSAAEGAGGRSGELRSAQPGRGRVWLWGLLGKRLSGIIKG